MTDSTRYIGTELQLFRHATHWKTYFAAQITPFIFGRVAEVGAGLGGTTEILHRASCERWTCLEPDAELASECRHSTRHLKDRHGTAPRVQASTLAALPASERFDTLLYIDVLEHIEQDSEELRQAAAHLSPGGHLVVLAPAMQWLFSPFDQSIGHYRRYSKATLAACAPAGLTTVRLRYLDSVGVAASLANRLLMRSSTPTEAQIKLWDSRLVPLSRRFDPLLGFALGKSVLAVWQA